MKTSGHLVNNGGIRGHSAGEFYPWRVMAQGTANNINWHVVRPNGQKTDYSYKSASEAVHCARLEFKLWSKQA